MKNWVPVFLLSLSACGGFSNEDLPFLNAVPHREDLASKLPASSTTSGLHGPSEVGRIMVGDHSVLYDGTHKASESFNNGLDGLLTVVETVISYPPSKRTTDSRTWGPYPDKDHPGFNVELVEERDPTNPANFTYWIEYEVPGSSSWFHLVDGTFLASEGVRKGKGSIGIHISTGRGAGVVKPTDFVGVDELGAQYDTAADPITVAMALSGPSTQVTYAYAERSTGEGVLAFSFMYQLNSISSWTAQSSWAASGAGVGHARASDGTNQETWTDCWNANFDVVFDQTLINGLINTTTGSPVNCQPL